MSKLDFVLHFDIPGSTISLAIWIGLNSKSCRVKLVWPIEEACPLIRRISNREQGILNVEGGFHSSLRYSLFVGSTFIIGLST